MSVTKAALKAAKVALDKQEYDEANEQARKALAIDPNNYHANVFLGLALDKQNSNDDSEKAYQSATKSKPTEPLAWQGLITLYEKQMQMKLDEYHQAAIHLAEIYMEGDDKFRCQSVIDRYTEFAKKCGSRQQYKHSLEILLPACTIYEYLEGRIPNPAYSYIRIADITEADEKEKVNKEIGERRTRLGAKIDQVITDVKREVMQGSDLERLYSEIINWTDDDETRRHYEEKLLQHAYDTLAISQGSKKSERRERVQNLSQGLVILKHPFALAWKITLEWKDVNELSDFDSGLLTEYIAHFPDDGLSKVLRGYLKSEINPFPKTKTTLEESQEDEDVTLMSSEDRLILMTEGIEESSMSILSHRVMGEYFLYLGEHESAVTVSRQAKIQLQRESDVSGLSLSNTADAISIVLATALVQYKAPRHHPEARQLFDHVLLHKPTHTAALIGVGLILEEQEDYLGAVDFLERALKRTPDPKIRAEVAWCRALSGDYETSLYELEACLPEMQDSDSRMKRLRSQTLHRVGVCLWERDSSKTARKDRTGAYARFLSSVQTDVNNAPAYTSLGVYYADYGKDRSRARKCFQKAFELSASEVGAAERLARSFASSGEWDLVEAVAQRVIESGKVSSINHVNGINSGMKKKGISWPFSAIGVVQLNQQDYIKSIVSFQSALRSSPQDYHSWVGLGESYHNSGRYIAATRAFEQAQKIASGTENRDVGDNWLCSYMLANVKRELGEFENAVAGYREVLLDRPKEFGVSIALLQTLIESSWRSIELGFFGRSATLAIEAVDVASNIAEFRNDAFDLWKAVGDACSIFSCAQAYTENYPGQKLRALLDADIEPAEYEILSNLDGIGKGVLQKLSIATDRASALQFSLQAAILANKRSIRVCAHDFHARAIAWYNLGWTEYRAHFYSMENMSSSSKKRQLGFLKASVQCFKKAIELEAGNAEFWNSLGIVTAALNPKVSQHSFVRSLHLNDRNARVWTNLGTLYLVQNDFHLANEAFTRAQSTDPDYAQAWVGQGMLATRLGETGEVHSLLTHAFDIAVSSSMIVKKQYAISAFDHLLYSSSSLNTTNILQPSLALGQLRCQQPVDFAFQHLSSLFAERTGDFSPAVQTLQKICFELETEYEASESTIALMRFSQAKSELSRVELAEQNFVSAAENAETALDLSAGDESDGEAHKKLRLSAQMSAGLAYYYQGSMDLAINMFRNALQETQGDPDIICLLAQVLWAKGGDDERTVAREQLLDCVAKFPGHFDAVVLLGAMAILEEDLDMIEAISVDLHSFQARNNLTPQQQRQIAQLLAAIATLQPGKEGEESSQLSAATRAVMISPSRPQGWTQLAELGIEIHPAEMAILTAAKAVPPGGSLGTEDLCKAYAGTNRLGDAQRAIMVAPWLPEGWNAFS